METKTAGILIIGDEILKGEVVEANCSFMCCMFRQFGVKVAKITVIGDDINEIAAQVSEFSKKFNYVVTAGGIGPTHDDVTYEGIAKAFRKPLVKNDELLKYWNKIYTRTGWNLKSTAWEKMVLIPENGKVTFFSSIYNNEETRVCVVVIENIFVLPGVPSLVKSTFPPLAREFFLSNTVFYSTVLYIKQHEELVIPFLNAVVEKYKGRALFGSYPIFSHPIYSTKLTVESQSKEFFDEAVTSLKTSIPKEWQVNDLEVAGENIQKALSLFPFINRSVTVLDECFKKYSLNKVAVAFNGGKDCTALLFLIYAYCRYREISVSSKKLQVVFFCNSDLFPEIIHFIDETVERYDLQLIKKVGEIKSALSEVLLVNSHWEAILMGTRQSDPHSSSLQTFQMTDQSWPKVMRVNPILHWSYDDVWFFLRYLNVPYCKLYDDGYTSLGNGSNTKRNEDLQYKDENGTVRYYPAFKLKDSNKERTGRS